MGGISRAGIDTAGGVIRGGGQAIARINGVAMVVVNDAVLAHGSGSHQSAKMVQGSAIIRVNGVPVVMAGCRASCGHIATGSPNAGSSA